MNKVIGMKCIKCESEIKSGNTNIKLFDGMRCPICKGSVVPKFKDTNTDLSIKINLDTEEFSKGLNTLASHFNVVSERIKEISPILKFDLKDKIKIGIEQEVNNMDINMKIKLDIKEALEYISMLRRELNEYKEQRIESLTVITKDQFIVKNLDRYKSREEIIELWNEVSKGYNFILKVRDNYYSVEYLNNMLMDCDKCKYNLNVECKTCEYTDFYSKKVRQIYEDNM